MSTNDNISISKEQLAALKASYDANAEELEQVENDSFGIRDASESFEQGYNNALEFVFRTIGVNISDLSAAPAPQGFSLKDARQDKQPCCYCMNAKVVPELCDDNDLHYHSVGESEKGFRIMLTAGAGKPCHIIFEQWHEVHGWSLLGYYYPDHCPKCGRALTEFGGSKHE